MRSVVIASSLLVGLSSLAVKQLKVCCLGPGGSSAKPSLSEISLLVPDVLFLVGYAATTALVVAAVASAVPRSPYLSRMSALLFLSINFLLFCSSIGEGIYYHTLGVELDLGAIQMALQPQLFWAGFQQKGALQSTIVAPAAYYAAVNGLAATLEQLRQALAALWLSPISDQGPSRRRRPKLAAAVTSVACIIFVLVGAQFRSLHATTIASASSGAETSSLALLRISLATTLTGRVTRPEPWNLVVAEAKRPSAMVMSPQEAMTTQRFLLRHEICPMCCW